MFKQIIVAAGLCAIAFSVPVAAQDAAPAQCKATTTAAREMGSRAAVGRRLQAAPDSGATDGGQQASTGITKTGAGTLEVAPPESDPAAAARMQCSNNLKQLGLGHTGQ